MDHGTTPTLNNTFSTFATVPPSQPINHGLYGSQVNLFGGVSTISVQPSPSVSLPVNQIPTQPSAFLNGSNNPPSAPVSTLSQTFGLANEGQTFVKPVQEKKFETKSTVWADTLNKGLVDLNIAGRKLFSFPL